VHDPESAEVSAGYFHHSCSLVEILVPTFHERGHVALGLGLDAACGYDCSSELEWWY
jgi:hypothetical protein